MIKKIHFENEVSSTKSASTTETWNLKPGTKKEPRSFAPSVQSDLFEYLKPHQRAALKPYLRLIKRDYQEKLCISLLDYLEGHGLDTLSEPVLNRMQTHIIEDCRLRPLSLNSQPSSLNRHEPKSIGTVIRQFLAGFSSPSSLTPSL